MNWRGLRESGNVEDGRGSGGGRLAIGGGLGTLAVVVIALLLGKNPTQLLNTINGGSAPTEQTAPQQTGQNDEGKQFVSKVLGSTEDVWSQLFRDMGKTYVNPKLHLFTGGVESGCGNASAATGPFYCPLDQKVYIDLDFFNELNTRFHASGDFANAYVIAHEVGHHVQNLLGISDKVHQMQEQGDQRQANQLSVRLELQADFYAGVWAHHAQEMKSILESGDLEEALNAASAIGDDRLQKEAQGTVVPDAFTHGTSAQRVQWFKKGFDTGDMKQGDTFAADL